MNERAADTTVHPVTDEHVPDRQVKRVVVDLWSHSEVLVRQEFALVKAEYEMRWQVAKAAALRGAVSAALFYAAYLTTLAALVLVLAQWAPPWISALLIGVVAAAIAFAFLLFSKRAFGVTLQPLLAHSHTTNLFDSTSQSEPSHRQQTQS